ncbi:hypothetical protein EDB85DRAFT_2164642 [Lactarius pseudohatsudake]|nr:hypothetical protein EDB85DRAFT_2164642 [Lactarius pseudohatsudake]
MPPKPKPPAPPITIQQIAGTLNSVVAGLNELLAHTPDLSGEVRHIINSFLTTPSIVNIMGAPQAAPAHTTTTLPPTLLKDMKDIKASLAALQKATVSTTQTGKNSTPKPQTGSPQEPAQKPSGRSVSTFAKAAALPPRPSVVLSLANTNWNGSRPSPARICEGINAALEHAQNDQTRVSAARWTARDNLVLTGSPDTTAQSLQLATPTIRQHFSESYPDSRVTLPTLRVRPNVKWSKLLINSVPTGVSPESHAYTPDECHAALVGNNPTYASLHVTQRPSWVRNPDSYSDDAVSSLVVAFEDPDGSLARGLLAGKVLFIFGNCATTRKWKQRPSIHRPKTKPTPNAPKPQSHAQPPHESVPTSPEPPQFVFGLDLDPTPSHAGPPSRSTQDMEGESDNAGRSRITTRSSNNKT